MNFYKSCFERYHRIVRHGMNFYEIMLERYHSEPPHCEEGWPVPFFDAFNPKRCPG